MTETGTRAAKPATTNGTTPASLPEKTGWQRLREPFPPDAIGQLPRKNRATGTTVLLDYVGHADVTDRLLAVDPEWTWEPLALDAEGLPALRRDEQGRPVALWIRLTVLGVTRLGVGTVESGAFDPEKQLIGDALRNAAMRFGVGLDLWRKGEREGEPEGSGASAPPTVPCPRCGLPLRERTGPRGPFVGCSSYKGKEERGCGFAQDGTLADLAQARTQAERPRGHLSDEAVAAGVDGRPPVQTAGDVGLIDELRTAVAAAPLAKAREAFTQAKALPHFRVIGGKPALAADDMRPQTAAAILRLLAAEPEAELDDVPF